MTRAHRDERALVITCVRLVGFHNFVDETIALSAQSGSVGTHLFLVGDNGSGKSTLLDAIHLVLTGADTELNAAARVGARDRSVAGRTLAGIVLRQRDDRGEGRVREGSAVAYAAIELANEAERWTLGVGLGATTLDAPVARWGLVHRGPLGTVPFTMELERGDERLRRPRTADELADAIGQSAVSRRIGDYRARVADLFFGGERGYEKARRLWSIAKAYREIAASTREPSELVARLLPAPQSDALESIRTSIAHLDELERDAGLLEAQRARIAGIVACQAEVAALRGEARALRQRATRLELAELSRELAERDAQHEALRADEARAIDRHTRAEQDERLASTALAAARGAQQGPWIAAQGDARRSLEARRAEHADAQAVLGAAAKEADEARRMAARAEAELAAVESAASERLREAVAAASRLPDLLPCTTAFARGGGSQEPARAELIAALAAARDEHAAAALRVRESERAVVDASRDEPVERVTTGAAALATLRAAGIDVISLDQAIEPRGDALPEHVAALEALLPEDAWATLITAGDDVPRARALSAAHPGARLAVHRGSAPLPPWVEALLVVPEAPLARRAHEALGHELAATLACEAPGPPDALGCVGVRGVCVRAASAPLRLGERVRTQARQARAADRADRLERARVSARDAESALERARADGSALEAALRALDATSSRDIAERSGSRVAARARRARADEALEHARRTLEARAQAMADAERVLASLEEAPPAGERELLARLEVLEADALRALRAREAALEARVASASACADASRTRRALAQRLERARAAVDADASSATEDATTTLDALRAAMEHVARSERARMDELLGDGSRGVLASPPTQAIEAQRPALFVHLGDEADMPRLEDAAGRTPTGTLAELDRQLSEVRRAASERAREVFDGVVLGSLAGQLQREVEQLHETIAALNELLGRASYGPVRFAFRVTPRPERAELVSLVRRMSVLDPASRAELRSYVEERRADLSGRGDDPPDLLDYRRWFDVRLVTRRHDAGSQGLEDSPWTRERAATGSGGERGVPSHLVVLALARLVFDGARARAAPVLLDEAFHGIDGARREALLGFASDLGLQLVVASPDQDGVVCGLRSTTTLFVVKDERDDVHVVPYHYYDHAAGPQMTLAV